MTSAADFQIELSRANGLAGHYATKGSLLLRYIRASQPITRTEIAERLRIDKSTVTENVKPLITIGQFKSGEPAVHFRNYRATGKDAWIITREGASFTLPEVATAIQRLCRLFPYVPELLDAMKAIQGRGVDHV